MITFWKIIFFYKWFLFACGSHPRIEKSQENDYFRGRKKYMEQKLKGKNSDKKKLYEEEKDI